MKKILLSVLGFLIFSSVIYAQLNITLSIDGIPISTDANNQTRLCKDSCYNVIATVSGGTSPYTYQWYNGDTSQSVNYCANDNSGQMDTIYLTVIDSLGINAFTMGFTINLNQTQQNICLVTLDSASGKNLIIWEQSTDTLVASYNIYKETSTTNVYGVIANVPGSNLSTFVDTTSNPASVSAKYKMSTVDYCGSESEMLYALPHKTLHLTVNAGIPPAWNLIWENYEGLSGIKNRIWRGSSSNGLQLIDSVSTSATTYTDATPPAGVLFYAIEMAASNSCTPSFKTNPSVFNTYSSSFSNIADNSSLISISEPYQPINISISPNPTEGKINFINTNLFDSIEIYNVLGDRIFNKLINSSGDSTIDLSGHPKGIYFARMQRGNIVSSVKIILK